MFSTRFLCKTFCCCVFELSSPRNTQKQDNKNLGEMFFWVDLFENGFRHELFVKHLMGFLNFELPSEVSHRATPKEAGGSGDPGWDLADVQIDGPALGR
jgi:hypothetical protein